MQRLNALILVLEAKVGDGLTDGGSGGDGGSGRAA
jgi:hypothetical protein